MPTSTDVSIVASRADAMTLTVPALVDVVETAGYHTGGDGGGALYKRVASAPAHAGKFQDASAAWFEICSLEINARQFGAIGDQAADDTAALQSAIDYCQAMGKNLFIPEGRYKLSASLKVGYTPSGHDYRFDAFRISGAGAVSIWLDWTTARGTILFTEQDVPLLHYVKNAAWVAQSGNFYFENIRLQQVSETATAAVIKLDYLGGHSRLSELEIVNMGSGDGIHLIDSNGDVTFNSINIANRDLVAFGLATARVGTGVRMEANNNGCLVRVAKVRCRGFRTGFSIDLGSAYKLEQVECSVVNDGVVVGTAARAALIDASHFEGIEGRAIVDRGNGTQVTKNHIYAYYATVAGEGAQATTVWHGVTAIDSTEQTNSGCAYNGNSIFVGGSGSVGIDLFSKSDGSNLKKIAIGNMIKFDYGLTPGASKVKGIRVTSSPTTSATAVDLFANTFIPEREWTNAPASGGTETAKIDHKAGRNIGVMPITDQYNEYPLFGQVGLMLAQGASALTTADVNAGDLAVGAASAYDTDNIGNVSSITPIGNQARWLKFNVDAGSTFKRTGHLYLSGDFSGPGSLLLEMRRLGTDWYGFEISRAKYSVA